MKKRHAAIFIILIASAAGCAKDNLQPLHLISTEEISQQKREAARQVAQEKSALSETAPALPETAPAAPEGAPAENMPAESLPPVSPAETF